MDHLRWNFEAADYLHLNIIAGLRLRLRRLQRGWLLACRGRQSSLSVVAQASGLCIIHGVHRLSLLVHSLLRCDLWRRLARLLEAALRLVDELLVGRFHGLLLHEEVGERVEHVLVEVSLATTEELGTGAVDAGCFRFPILRVLHLEEAFATHVFFCALDRRYAAAVDWQTHLLADKVRVWPQFDQVSVDVAVAELADQALFDNFLV